MLNLDPDYVHDFKIYVWKPPYAYDKLAMSQVKLLMQFWGNLGRIVIKRS